MATSFVAAADMLPSLSAGQASTGSMTIQSGTVTYELEADNLEQLESDMQQMLEEFQSQLYTVDQPRSALLIGVYVPLFVCSVVGNILVLVLVLPFRRMRNVTHCFIVNLAVSDLLRT